MLGITYWMLFAHQFISIETVAQVVIHDTFMFGLLYCGGVASDGNWYVYVAALAAGDCNTGMFSS